MKFLQTFEFYPFLDTVVALAAAFVLGTLIGAERQYRQRTAGLRTNVLVAVGAAAFVDLAQRIAGTTEAVRVISYVVSGIGFLGAGVIMKEGMNVRGLNTAATLWCSAAVGACAGTDMIAEAALLTIFVLAGNTLLRPLVNMINRIPIDDRATEATYEVSILSSRDAMPDMRDLLVERLEQANYPVSDVEIVDRGDDTVEIVATLVSTAVNPHEIEEVTTYLAKQAGVSNATWDGSTKD
ncbi:MAG: MgtC/SapB family protein [Aquamicrobium sp.]|uniref:MgtC/SapB family protein n=1 Tax=Mesorhizobium sp. Pch-S TaxID=2082387 RepID=UPI0010111472|nr:MgtC/SapB family protein [Mesorhizobium sp. Pch-S]MBR2687558.1 MgtC/SapB family protein [Aquamicrobium sp.]QAZ45232.1 methyltransferase [Mesorhizobium sp. Pch-S]